MNLGAIFIGLALLVLAIPFVLDPFRKQQRRQFADSSMNKRDANGSPEDALFALRDLEFDYQTEKIIDEDYQNIRAALLAQAAEGIQTKKQEDVDLEEMIRSRRRSKATGNDCPKCGRAIQDEDNFCTQCGCNLKTQPKNLPSKPIKAS